MEANTGNKEVENCNFIDTLFERARLEIRQINNNEKDKSEFIEEMEEFRKYIEYVLNLLLEINRNSLYKIYLKKFRSIGFEFKSLPEHSDGNN